MKKQCPGGGYECGLTTLFNETVTATNGEASLSYASLIDADSVVVTLNGTDYTCSVKISTGVATSYDYGATQEEGVFDYSEYPFALRSLNLGGVYNRLYVPSDGTYSIQVATESLNTTECFEKAVKSIVDVGYECSETSETLFDDDVTTDAGSHYADAEINPTESINADHIRVTIDGTEYECDKSEVDSSSRQYGAPYDPGTDVFDFSEYPFGILIDDGECYFNTQTAGTYTIKIETVEETATTTPCFEKAVKSVAKGGKAFTYVGEGTCGSDTYVEYNITYNDFINARNNGTNIVYTLMNADKLQARNIVAFDCIEESEYYEVQAIYAQVTAGTPFPTVDWIPLTLFCDTTDGYMRDINCWEEVN